MAFPIKEVRMPESASVLSVLMNVSPWNFLLVRGNSRKTSFELLANFFDGRKKKALARPQCLAESGSRIREILQLGI